MMKFDEAMQYLPDLVSLPGFIFYSVFAYVISFSISVCMAKFVEKNMNIE